MLKVFLTVKLVNVFLVLYPKYEIEFFMFVNDMRNMTLAAETYIKY